MRSSQPVSARARAAKVDEPVDGHQRRAERPAAASRRARGALGLGRAAQRLERVVGRQPELRAVVAGADVLVRVGLDARRDADQRARRRRPSRARSTSSSESTTTSAPASAAARELLVGLVVAVHDEPLAGDARRPAANRSSPSVETSAPMPSSASSRSSATFGNAFVP